jgi:hypothetical protein
MSEADGLRGAPRSREQQLGAVRYGLGAFTPESGSVSAPGEAAQQRRAPQVDNEPVSFGLDVCTVAPKASSTTLVLTD